MAGATDRPEEIKRVHAHPLDVLRGSLPYVIPALAFVITLILSFYIARTETSRIIIRETEVGVLDLQHKSIRFDIQNVLSDLKLLAGLPYISMLSNPESAKSSPLIDDLATEFKLVSAVRGIYDQVRYLDRHGMEVVRVNYNGGHPAIVSAENLQNKKGRYYFEDTISLEQGQIFISPLDLNIEQGQIEQPLKPMIRFGTPLYGTDGQAFGIILLNYFGRVLLDRFVEQGDGAYGQSFLLNRDGYYLYAADQELAWGFMHDAPDKTFGNHHQEAWKRIHDKDKGQFETPAGLYTFSTVRPLSVGVVSSTGSSQAVGQSQAQLKSDEYVWKLVSFVPRDIFDAEADELKGLLGVFMVLLTLAIIIASSRIAYVQNIRLQLQRAQRELIKQLQEKTAEQEHMVYTVTHDLKGPLLTVAGFLEFLEEDFHKGNEEAFKKNLQMIDLSAKRMKQLVDELLQLARVGIRDNQIESISLDLLVKNSLNVVSGEIVKSGAHVEVEPDLPEVRVDIEKYQHVFENLITNAIKFSRSGQDGPRVRIRTRQEGHELVCCVSDNGIGIAPENLQKVFTIFEKLDPNSEGSGVGLAIVKRIVESHGGRIWVESAGLGEGSTFCFTVPGAAGNLS